MSRSAPLATIIAAYCGLLLCAVLAIPLRIPEVLQLAARHGLQSIGMTTWIAMTPDSSPLNYYVQLPFLQAFGDTRLGARLDSLLFAAAASYVFFRLAARIRLQRPLMALALFMLLPINLQLLSQGRPFAQALFLLLLATEFFFRLIERPGVLTAAMYAVLLTLCIYTDRYAFWVAVGYLLFLFRFVNRAPERRATWYVLPATILPGLAFLPFLLWASSQSHPYWPFPPRPASAFTGFIDTIQAFSGNEWFGVALLLLLLAGFIAGNWATFRPRSMGIPKKVALFCFSGGVITTVLVAAVTDHWLGGVFGEHQIVWAFPATILLTVAALEWLSKGDWLSKRDWLGKSPVLRTASVVAAVALLVLCAIGDYLFFTTPTEDLQTEAALIQPELTHGACVVFVSERFSKVLFQLFAPTLNEDECRNFFHNRIVLASHPYVQPQQQENAESFFRGLNFVVTKRIHAGGGEIVVFEQSH